MRSFPSLSAVSAGLLAAFVGFTSSFSVILQGLSGVGASRAEAASGLMAISVAMGAGSILLSARYRMPIIVAWSTPGGALLAGSGLAHGSFPNAVGAFLVAALLVVAAGVVRPLGRLIAAIPASVANAMLAGILFSLCLAPVKAVAAEPLAGLAVALVWVLVGRFNRLLAVPAAALVAVGAIVWKSGGELGGGSLLPHPVPVVPAFDLPSAVGIGIPLFLVTMASQNIPGLAVLRVHGYAPPPGPLFATTGVLSLLCAPFGGITANLAAITAAICAGEEAGPEPSRRWWAGVVTGLAYVVCGLGAGAVTAFASLSPLLIEAVAGLALVGTLAGALQAATASPDERTAAAVTFLAASSGVAFLGISAPFWGLVAGAALYAISPRRAASSPVGTKEEQAEPGVVPRSA
jgi:benzoate membrane transport protein